MEEFKEFLGKSLLEAKKRNFLDFVSIFFQKTKDLLRIIYFGLKVAIKLIFIKLG